MITRSTRTTIRERIMFKKNCFFFPCARARGTRSNPTVYYYVTLKPTGRPSGRHRIIHKRTVRAAKTKRNVYHRHERKRRKAGNVGYRFETRGETTADETKHVRVCASRCVRRIVCVRARRARRGTTTADGVDGRGREDEVTAGRPDCRANGRLCSRRRRRRQPDTDKTETTAAAAATVVTKRGKKKNIYNEKKRTKKR